MAVPLIDLGPQHAALLPEFMQAFEGLVRSGQFILGPHVEGFEQKLAAWCGAGFAVGMSSGTDAILAALMALDIGPGDEVIMPPFTFFATAGCVTRLGAKPVFVDIEPASFNIDPARIESAITPRTKAIMPVHLFGQCAEMEPIMALARRRGIKVIEDAAQAIGARAGQRQAGTIGDIGCLSFYPTKNLSAMGDAGACLTNDADLAERMRVVRLHGMKPKYFHSRIGGNFRIDALQAAVLSIKLPHLAGWTEARRANARCYGELLSGLPLTLPTEQAGKFHVFNQYTVRINGGGRDGLRKHLAGRGIGHEVYYPLPLHLQPCFACLGGKRGDFPESERAADRVLSLPIYPELRPEQQREAAVAVSEFFR